MRFDLNEGFPMLTTKRLHWPSIAHELLWFLSGITNIDYLVENNVKIWDAWADEWGDLGPIYGQQWRSWGSHYKLDCIDNTCVETTTDQIANVIDQIRTN